MNDGIISLDTRRGQKFGFVSQDFDGWLWKVDDAIYISYIESKHLGSGAFRRLVERILDCGFTVKIPTPLGRMLQIVEKNGYEMTVEKNSTLKAKVEVWVLKPKLPNDQLPSAADVRGILKESK